MDLEPVLSGAIEGDIECQHGSCFHLEHSGGGGGENKKYNPPDDLLFMFVENPKK
jgi:hypothetical protein